MIFLRAQLDGEEDVMRDALDQLTSLDVQAPLPALVYEAFLIAVRKWAGTKFTRGQVIRLVASARVFFAEEPDLIDPSAAESEVLRALGQNVPPFPDVTACAAAQLTLLDFLVRDLGLSDDEINNLLEQAREAADRRLSTGSAPSGNRNAPFGPWISS